MRSLLLVPALTGALLAAPGDKPIQGAALTWRPTFRLSESLGSINLTPFAGRTIAVRSFTDNRKVKDLLGENLEHDEPVSVTTRDNVAAFLTDHSVQILREAGLPITEKTEGATLVLSAEVTRFHVAERNTYDADCQLVFQLEANGKVLWRGSVLGHATRWGRSMKLENYCEALSNSLLDGLTNLLKDPAFLKAIADDGVPSK